MKPVFPWHVTQMIPNVPGCVREWSSPAESGHWLQIPGIQGGQRGCEGKSRCLLKELGSFHFGKWGAGGTEEFLGRGQAEICFREVAQAAGWWMNQGGRRRPAVRLLCYPRERWWRLDWEMENQRWEETDLQIPSSFVEKKNKLDSQIISPLCEKYKPQKSVKTIGITHHPASKDNR